MLGSDASNLLEYGPTERNINTGKVLTSVTSPQYVITYGFRQPVLLFHTPSSESDTMFSNYLDVVAIDNLSLQNLTFYNPGSPTAVFAKFGEYIQNLYLTNINVDGVNSPLNAAALFDIRTRGLTLRNLSATNLEKVSYSYSSGDFLYVNSVGPLLQFTSYAKVSGLDMVPYTLVSHSQ